MPALRPARARTAASLLLVALGAFEAGKVAHAADGAVHAICPLHGEVIHVHEDEAHAHHHGDHDAEAPGAPEAGPGAPEHGDDHEVCPTTLLARGLPVLSAPGPGDASRPAIRLPTPPEDPGVRQVALHRLAPKQSPTQA